MSDAPTPIGGPPPADQANLQLEAQPEAQAGAQAASQSWTKPGKRRNIVVFGVIIAFLAIVLYVVRNNVQADDLKVGDCFNVPTATSFQTVEKHPCTESHTAEVIFVGEYTGTSFPISISLDSYIDEQCVPAFEAYVGRAIDSDPELSLGYFHPSRDGWDNGDKTVTCYIAQPDESPMTESLKAT